MEMGQSTPIKRKPGVLVVEDERLIGAMVAQALSEWGFSVHSVDNAGDALDWLASGAAVDLLFTDINLPGGMDGATLAQRAREIHPDLPVLYASGQVSVENLRRVPNSTFVAKPYSPTHICTIIARMTALRRPPVLVPLVPAFSAG